MAIVVDNVFDNSGSNTNSVACSLDVGATADFIVATTVTWGNNRTPTGVTWNGTSMTRVGTGKDNASSTVHTEIYYLASPTTGTHDAIITMPDVCNGVNIAVTSLIGARLSSQPDATGGNTGSATDGISNALTVIASGSIVFDAIGDSSAGMTEGGSQAGIMNSDGSTSRCSYLENQGPGSVNMSWTWSGSEQYAQMIASFAPDVPTTSTTSSSSSVTTTSISTISTSTSSTSRSTTSSSSSSRSTSSSSSSTSSTSSSTIMYVPEGHDILPDRMVGESAYV